VQEKLRRVKQMYKDLLISDEEYKTNTKKLQDRLASLILPSSPHLTQAAEYLEQLGMLWSAATEQEQKDITRILINNIYVDVKEKRIVSIEPAPIFRLLFTEFCEDLGIGLD
jgi:hypothetical protein